MGTIADGSLRRLTYKAHASGVIDPTVNADPTVDPGSSGGQIIPYVSGLAMDAQRSENVSKEKRPDQQQYDTRMGIITIPSFTLPIALSPKTYQDLFAAVLRNTWSAGVSFTNSAATNLAATASSSKFTLGSSTWVAQGAKVGMTFRATNISGANLGINFTITALNGVDATVYPPPVDMIADTSFTVTFPGRTLEAPEAGALVQQLLCFEDYRTDLDSADVITQCRLGMFTLTMPVEGEVTGSFGGVARNTWPYSGSGAPVFTAPAAAVETQHVSQVGGHFLIDGAAVIYMSEISNFQVTTNPAAIKTGFSPTMLAGGISTSDIEITADFSGVLYDGALQAKFLAETTFESQIHLPVGNAANAEFVHLYMPRVKLTDMKRADSDSGPIPISGKLRALRKGVTTGFPSGPILIQDSLSA